MMYNNFPFLKILAVIILLTSCSNDSPKDVARKALDCLISDNYQGYLDYSNMKKDEKEELINSEIIANMVFGKNNPNDHRVRVISYKLGKEKRTGDSATVEYSYIYENDDTIPGVYDMVKIQGKWLIDMQ